MVFRKPYAFFIKYFKLIHAFIFLLLCYIIYNTTKISSLLATAANNNTEFLGKKLVSNYIPALFRISPFIVVILLGILLVVFIRKKKSIKEYVISLLMVLLAYAFLSMSFISVDSIEVNILETRYLRLVRDLSIISCILQIYPLIIAFIRLTGFDIKKFDFEKDLIDLDISEKDREEFEVDFDIDTNLYKRRFNRFRRLSRYFIKENKKLLIAVSVVIVGLVGLVIYNNIYKYNSVINYGEEIYNNQSSFIINKSYVINSDYNGKEINNDFNYLLVELDAKSTKDYNKINKSYFELFINNHIFHPLTKYAYELKDIGKVYFDNDLTKEYQRFLLVYQIPKEYSYDTMKLKVIKTLNKFLAKDIVYYDILTLNNIDLINGNKQLDYKVNDNLEFKDYINKGANLKITNYEISDSFLINYLFKSNNISLKSIEYAKPRFTGYYDKKVMKISYNYECDNYYNDFYNLMYYTAKINYKIGKQSYTISEFYKVETRTSQNKNLYIEVPENIIDSNYIDITFNIRNSQYKYLLRGE